MRADAWARDSLRGALTLRLVTAFTLIGLAAAGIAYKLGEHFANLAYDRALADDVLTLAGQLDVRDGRVELNLPPAARAWLLANEGESVLYRVIDLRDGHLVDGNGELGPWPRVRAQPPAAQFREAHLGPNTFRIGFVTQLIEPGGVPVLVEVGETLGRRQRVARQTLIGSLLLFGLMMVVTVLLVGSSIRRTLRPLGLLEAEAANRSGANLTPLQPQMAPREVRGLILAINRMMQRVSESIDAQSRFIANAAHQLRTPISGLRLQAQLAQDETSTTEAHARLQEIDRSAARAAHVIEQLLTLSRSEAGAARADFRAVDLTATAAQVIERHLDAAARKNIDLGCSGLPGPVTVQGNETLLAELIGNLVDNAVRYVPRSGVVTVDIGRRGAQPVLEVIDDGPGIGTIAPESLFERFQRGDTAPGQPVQSGAGLGLAIVKEIAERHDATVSCASPAGGGFRVTVVFPAAAADDAHRTAAAQP